MAARALSPSPLAPRRLGGVSLSQWAATLGVSAAAGLALAGAGDWWVAFGLLAVAALTAIGLLRPALFLALFLLVRPLLDEFSQVTAGADSANAAGALGLLLVAITFVAVAVRRDAFVPASAPALVAVVLASVVAAAQASFELGGTIGLRPTSELARLAALVAVLLLAANVTGNAERAKTLFALVGLSAAIPAGYGIWELIVGAPVKEGTDVARISGTFTGPVPFGAFLSLTSLVLIFGPVERVPNWVRWPALGAMLVALTVSYSRVGWVLFVLGILILGWPSRKALVAAFGAVLLVTMIAVPSVRERALPLGEGSPSAASSSAGYESYDWRISNWEGLLGEWRKQPLLGYGLESSTFVNPRSPVNGENRPGGGYEAHNMFVRILVEGGIVQLAAYLLLLVAIMSRMRRLARERWELREASRLLYVIWGLIFFAGMTTDDPFHLTAMMVGVLALTGAVEGAHRGARLARQTPQGGTVDTTEGRRPAAPAVAG